MAKKVIFTEKQIKMIAESEMMKMEKEEKHPLETVTEEDIETALGKDLGDDEDKKIEYPSTDMDSSDTTDFTPEEEPIKAENIKGAHELLEYLDKLEEAKSILSKIAAREDKENIKSRIYAHYDKTQKLIFELIKEFGIVH